ncbi:MerR family transcriptional regulator [Brevundimonas pondensis]|uniref:MerR family transcriptional regulator n=1 Tax=Brevundimonas pondensis TaxID=2774189 RepID=UPI001A9FB637|nr:helix-turn-helix domain-containing protein [Brevundimonas pondensis]
MTLSIGELGRRAGAKVETIRYYERIGLLPAPARTEGNYRAYGEAALNRMSFIRRARDLGFSIEQVRDLLALSDRRDQSCATVDELTRAHLAEVERKIADLEALRRELSALLSQCRQGTISTCLIIEALAPTKA